MPVFDPSQPTTELEAVNSMLTAVGQTPLPLGTDLSTATDADVVIAINTLAKACREVQSAGWRFNTVLGYQLAPLGLSPKYVWTETGTGGTVTVTLNIFSLVETTPYNILSWKLTPCWQNGDLDMVERNPLATYDGFPGVRVLYDRTYNRDGAEAARYAYLYLDLVTAEAFDDMPESARRYVTIRAARQFAQQVLGSPEIRAFTREDEMMALGVLKKEEGLKRKLSFLDSGEAMGWAGGRPLSPYGPSRRVHRGGF